MLLIILWNLCRLYLELLVSQNREKKIFSKAVALLGISFSRKNFQVTRERNYFGGTAEPWTVSISTHLVQDMLTECKSHDDELMMTIN